MVTELPKSQGRVVGFQISGKLTDEDYTGTLIPRLEPVLESGQPAKLLLYFDETFDGWEAAAMWDDARFGTKHARDFGDIALVGAPSWIGHSAKLFAPFMKGELKLFAANELDAAWAWLQ